MEKKIEVDTSGLLNLIAGGMADHHESTFSNAEGGMEDDVDLLDAYSRAVTSVVERVAPSVVAINIEKNSPYKQQQSEGSGSGVIIAPDGFILTNNHVVENVSRVAVMLTDGRSLDQRSSVRMRRQTLP